MLQIVKAFVVLVSAELLRTEADKLEGYVKSMGVKGFACVKVGNGGEWMQSLMVKTVMKEFCEAVNVVCGAKEGDFLLM